MVSFCLLLLFLQAFSQASFYLVIKEKERYSNVWFNIDSTGVYLSDLNPKRSIIVSPNPVITNLKGSIDLCSNETYSSLIKPLNFTRDVCENYFCSGSNPFYLQEKSYSLKNHVDLHRFCLQCNATSTQRFEEVLKQRECSYFDKTICSNTTCTNRSSCIIFDVRGGLCYVWNERIYYRQDDFLHNTLYWVFFRYLGYLDLILYVFLALLFFIIVVVPELVFLFRSLDSSMGLFRKILHFYSLKSQSIYWINFSLIVFTLTIIIDLFEIANLKLCLLGVCLSVGMFYIAYINLIIKWLHVLKQSEENNQDSIPLISVITLLIFYALFIFIGIIGAVMIVGHSMLALSERTGWLYSLGVYVTLLMFINSILVLVLSILSIRIIYILSKNEMDFSKNLFKMNFSKTVLWMNISSIPLIIIKLLSSLLFLFGRDLFSLEFWLFYARVLNYIFFFSYIGFTVAFFRIESIKRTFCFFFLK